MIDIILMIFMTLIGATAAFNLKKSTSCSSIFQLFKNKYFYVGGLLYFISALLNIYFLKKYSYIFVFTFTSITYIWSLLFGYLFLKEKITRYKIIGVSLIVLGVFFIGISMR